METVKPTKKELSQVFYIDREIKNLQRMIEQYSDCDVKATKVNGMPPAKTNTPSKPTEAAAIKLAGLQEQLEALQYRCIEAKKKTMEYITRIEDSYMRQIVMLRCIELMSWKQVAEHVGGKNTAESCRVAFHREFNK